MDRSKLDEMSWEQLQETARSYRLPIRTNRNEVIETIMSHLEQHNPLCDLFEEEQGGPGHRTEKSTGQPIPTPQPSPSGGIERNQSTIHGDNQPVTAGMILQMLSTMAANIQMQQREAQMQQQLFMQQQQQQFAQLVQLLNNRSETAATLRQVTETSPA